MTRISGTPIAVGRAAGPSMVLDEPLSFWGGVNPQTGEIIDRHHPQWGQTIAGTILILRHTRGSSGTPSVLTELVRAGTGPVGIILQIPDPMLVIGSLVIGELYPDRSCPVVTVGDDFGQLVDSVTTSIAPDGLIIQQT